MMLFVLVRDLNGEGEVVDWFPSEEDAFMAAQRLGGKWTIYGKYFEDKPPDIAACEDMKVSGSAGASSVAGR